MDSAAFSYSDAPLTLSPQIHIWITDMHNFTSTCMNGGGRGGSTFRTQKLIFDTESCATKSSWAKFLFVFYGLYILFAALLFLDKAGLEP